MVNSEPLPDKWHNRDLPVLREAVRMADESPIIGGYLRDIAERLDMPVDDVWVAARALDVAGLIELVEYAGPVGGNRIPRVSGQARQLAGQWPSEETALDRMIAALEAIAANTDDEDTRTKAQKFATWLKGSAQTVGLGVATAAITGQLPGQ